MAQIVKVIAKDGVSYEVDANGALGMAPHYQVILSAPLGEGELITSFPGIPAIGSQHPSRQGYYVSKYRISQPRGAAKHTLDVAVIYDAEWRTLDVIEGEEGDEGEASEVESAILEWGWDDGTSEKEFLTDNDGQPVLNSAGDMFETVPTIQEPSPTFTKSLKSKNRRFYTQYQCTVNQGEMTIGGMICPAGTLLCTIAEKKNIGDVVWPYTYTIRLRYRSNVMKIKGEMKELGWDIGITDAGMREKDDEKGGLKLIQVVSKETGELVTVASPELLDGAGHAVGRSASGSPAEPYNLEFKAYARSNFPGWMYSE
jgi:hypothetical protein